MNDDESKALAHKIAREIHEEGVDMNQTPEEFLEDVRRRSPAMAFAQDMGWLPGGPPPAVTSKLDRRVPPEVYAAVDANRAELLLPLQKRVEGGEVFSEEETQALHSSLVTFYRDNVQEPILSELLEALGPVGDVIAHRTPTTESSLLLLNKFKALLETIDHRRQEVMDGSVPIDQIPDGQSRSVPL